MIAENRRISPPWGVTFDFLKNDDSTAAGWFVLRMLEFGLNLADKFVLQTIWVDLTATLGDLAM
jgi:hypothetical protein